jgi:hypothetical protein
MRALYALWPDPRLRAAITALRALDLALAAWQAAHPRRVAPKTDKRQIAHHRHTIAGHYHLPDGTPVTKAKNLSDATGRRRSRPKAAGDRRRRRFKPY